LGKLQARARSCHRRGGRVTHLCCLVHRWSGTQHSAAEPLQIRKKQQAGEGRAPSRIGCVALDHPKKPAHRRCASQLQHHHPPAQHHLHLTVGSNIWGWPAGLREACTGTQGRGRQVRHRRQSSLLAAEAAPSGAGTDLNLATHLGVLDTAGCILGRLCWNVLVPPLLRSRWCRAAVVCVLAVERMRCCERHMHNARSLPGVKPGFLPLTHPCPVTCCVVVVHGNALSSFTLPSSGSTPSAAAPPPPATTPQANNSSDHRLTPHLLPS
jgi:hypothetical protein